MKKPTNILTMDIITENTRSTVSRLHFKGHHLGITLEDGYKAKKVYGQTRIPHGLYRLQKRFHGKHFERYSRRYGHDFTIEIMDIPSFTNVLFHTGNFIRDTEGCPLINTGYSLSNRDGSFFGLKSLLAYTSFYSFMDGKLSTGEDFWLNVNRKY